MDPLLTQIRAWEGAGDTERLCALHEALRELKLPPAHKYRVRNVAWGIEQALCAMPGLGVPALLRLVSRPPAPWDDKPASVPQRLQRLGGRLASHQPREVLLSTLAREGSRPETRELLACWMHDAVSRGGSLVEEAPAQGFQAVLVEACHPLAVLPLQLLEVELDIVDRRATGSSASAPAPPAPRDSFETTPHEVEDPVWGERLLAALSGWMRSTGRAEARVFTLSPPAPDGALGEKLLARLGLECLQDLETRPRASMRRIEARTAFSRLFSAASSGGAQALERYGGYGRLDAWRSLGALVGTAEEAPVSEVNERALACAWLEFEGTPWFYDSTLGLGLAALRPDGASLAVLAGTDIPDDEPSR